MTEEQQPEGAAPETSSPPCPRCGSEMWDNRATKKNPRAPDYKCKAAGCEGVIWPPREPGAAPVAAKPAGTADDPACPVCGGKMWDDRASKRNPRAPDFKCRNKPRFQGGPGCEGVIWPPRDGERRPSATPSSTRRAPAPGAAPARASAPPPPPPPAPEREFSDDEAPDFGDDDLPF
ncbi:MAG TPA: hypothetical protein VG432_07845 [Gemmatimonadaceae bacterium]|nr:hypothetical protein [Gemmatimonadaceae bacterium]